MDLNINHRAGLLAIAREIDAAVSLFERERTLEAATQLVRLEDLRRELNAIDDFGETDREISLWAEAHAMVSATAPA